MTKKELQELINAYDAFIYAFRSSQFVVDGTAQKLHDLLETLIHDDCIVKEGN